MPLAPTRSSLSILLLAAASCAHAFTGGTASLSNTQVSFVDLNSADGITPALTPSNIETVLGLNVRGWPVPGDAFAAQLERRRTTLEPINAVASIPLGADAAASSSFEGGLFGALSERVYVNVPGDYQSAQGLRYDFTLTPMSQVTFSGVLTSFAESYGPRPPNQYAQTSAVALFFDPFNAPGTAFSTVATVSTPIGPDTDFQSLTFAYTYVNTNAFAITGTVIVNLAANGVNVSTIPEPSTGMLMGLSIALGVLLRRRLVGALRG